jgi:hypothetical protein
MRPDREAGNQTATSDSVLESVKQRSLVLRFLVTSSGRCAWRWAKNCIKILLAREPYFDEHCLFLRQYVLHLAGLRRIRKVTCTGLKAEGAGSQALMIMKAINFCRATGLTYVHRPFSSINHATRPMDEWVAAWETLFNFGTGEIDCDADRHDVVNFCYNFHNLGLYLGWPGQEDDPAHFRTVIPEFRRKYYLNKSPRMTDEITVAVHIRRGDALPNDPDYFTANQTILRTITSVKSMLDAHMIKYSIRIYSQGIPADFADLCLPGVELFLDVDAVWTMGELIEADVLIMAKGCFSYCAGLISDGIKICETMVTSSWRWPPLHPMDNWLTSFADGSFDSAAFEGQLSLLLQSKAMFAATNRPGGSD